MYDFFKVMQSVANTSAIEYKSIAQLTKDIAISGGFKRELRTLKNGKIVEKVIYDKPFDDVLVAKWFMFYKNFFIGKLSKHPELKDFFVTIIDRTFMHLMKFIRLEKLVSDKNVTAIVNMSFSNRIGEVLIDIGSNKRLEKKQKGNLPTINAKSTDRIHLTKSLNYLAYSLDEMIESGVYQPGTDDDIDNYLYISDLRGKLKSNPYGNKLLDALLTSSEKVNLHSISNYVDTRSEKDSIVLTYLKDALDIISEHIGRDSSKLNIKIGKPSLKLSKIIAQNENCL